MLSAKKCFKTSIGGQALIEGVMMRGPEKIAMAVRLPDGGIDVETEALDAKAVKKWYKKVPLIRGVFNMVDNLKVGYRYLMKSAEKAGLEEEEEEPSGFEKWLTDKFGDKLMKGVMVAASVVSVAVALLLFAAVPTFVTKWIGSFADLGGWRNVLEGVIKIGIFVAYLAAISGMKDIKRLFQYHGGEHKTIFCYEAGLELTVENVRRQPRFHPRCGTSFILIVLVIGILVFSLPFVPWDNGFLRVGIKLLLLPVIAGIAYEIIKLAGRYDNPATRIISAPGLWMQRLTTREPDDGEIEVAIASFKAVMPDNKEDAKW